MFSQDTLYNTYRSAQVIQMATTTFMHRRVRARKQEEVPEDFVEDDELSIAEGSSAASDSDVELPSEEEMGSEGDSTQDGNEDDDDNQSDISSPPSPQSALKDISFGALATVQDSLGPSRKRKRHSTSQADARKSRSPSPFHEASERQAGRNISHVSRTSKHAPMEVSSKKAVSRKRSVVPVPTVAPRDPRFSALSGGVDRQRVEKNYKFLDDYRQSEIVDLKTRIRKEKNTFEKDRLRREMRAMEDKQRARKREEEEQEIVREHKKKEKDQVKDGKKPFFLKKGDIKKEVLKKRFENMGEKKAEKAMERRRKKKASRERKSMPSERRTAL